MKKNAAFFCILIATAVLGNALDRSRYREVTLPQFEEWKQGVPREGTEPELFKARVLFEELSDTAISFADPGKQTSIYFTVDKTWPEMEEGRQVVIYFTAGGSWSWNRVLDEIDNALARDLPAGDPAAAGPAYARYDQEQYDQDQYDQTGYDGEGGEFEGPAQDGFLAQAEPSGPKDPNPPGRLLPPSSRLPQAPSPPHPASGDPAPSAKVTGAPARPGRIYRLQVGAFTVEKNAARTLSRLKEAGFSPNYERHGQYLRVVLSGVRAADVEGYVERITRAGFSEIWRREER
jgi:hypothetical protein